jgi:hypothetical protein
MGIFRYKSIGLTVSGPYSYSRSLCIKGAVLIPRHFFIKRVLEGRKPDIAGLYGGPQSIFRFYKGSIRSLYKPIEFPVSTISFIVQLYSQ